MPDTNTTNNFAGPKITMPDMSGVGAAIHVALGQARRLIDANCFIEKMAAVLEEAGVEKELWGKLIPLAENLLLEPVLACDPFGDPHSCLRVADVPMVDEQDCEAIDTLYGHGFAKVLLASSPVPVPDHLVVTRVP